MIVGEDNTYFHTNLCPCTFSKLIEYWRSIWYERTNSNTDPTFPFGFVQVNMFSWLPQWIYVTMKQCKNVYYE